MSASRAEVGGSIPSVPTSGIEQVRFLARSVVPAGNKIAEQSNYGSLMHTTFFPQEISFLDGPKSVAI